MAGPDFTNLGVTNPVTGKPVYLGAGEISTVLGATGGVAPTVFSSAVKGAVQGVETAQAFQLNQGNIEATQQQNQLRQMQIETEKATQESQVLAENNQNNVIALTKQAEYEKLQRDNTVLSALRTGDLEAVQTVITDPNLMLSAIENKKFVDAGAGRLRAQGLSTPEFESALDVFNRTANIYAQGPVEAQYNQAQQAAAGTQAFQQLKSTGQYSSEELLNGMQLGQISKGFGAVENVLVAPDGKGYVTISDKQAEQLAPFFAARERLPQGQQKPANPFTPPSFTEKDLPLPGEQNAAAAQVPTPAPTTAPAQTPEAAQAQPTTTPQPGAPVAPGIQASGQPGGVIVNGKSVAFPQGLLPGITGQGNGANGQALGTFISNMQALQGLPLAERLRVSLRLAAPAVNRGAKGQKDSAQTSSLMMSLDSTITKIERGLKGARELNVPLGGGLVSSGYRALESTGIGGDNAETVRRVYEPFQQATNEMTFTLVKEIVAATGSAQTVNSNIESARLEKLSPGVHLSEEGNQEILEVLKAKRQQLVDGQTIKQLSFAQHGDQARAEADANEYLQNTVYYKTNEDGFISLDEARKDPIDFLAQKYNIDMLALGKGATEAVPVQQTPAPTAAPQPGSQTANPFAPQQPAASTPLPGAQKVSATVPATSRDLKVMAKAIESGEGVNAFRGTSALPKKMEKASTDLIARVAHFENLSAGAIDDVSSAGAEGVMQIMPKTGAQLARKAKVDYDPKNVPQNLRLGSDYLNERLKARDGNVELALADYNWGLGRVNDALEESGLTHANATIDGLSKVASVPEDTQNYIKQITGPQSFRQAGLQEQEAGDLESYTTPLQQEDREETVGRKTVLQGDEETHPQAPVVEASVRGTPAPSQIMEALNYLNPFSASVAQAEEPTSPIEAALPTEKKKPTPPALVKAVDFLNNNPVGQFLSEYENLATGSINSYVNSLMFGGYDEGVGFIADQLGFDGDAAREAAKAEHKKFAKENPGLNLAADIAGFIGGWQALKKVGGSILTKTGLRAPAAAAEVAEGAVKSSGVIQKGARVAAEVAAPTALRGFGEGEGGAQKRVMSGLVTGGVATGLTGVVAGASKLPVVGPALAAGAVIGGLTSPTNPLYGGVQGAVTGTVAATLAKVPAFQKAFGQAMYKLNNWEGFKTIGTALNKLVTGKTPSEIMENVSPAEAAVLRIMSYKTPAELKTMLTDLQKAKAEDVPLRLFEKLNNDAVETKMKVLRQMAGDETSALGAKIREFTQERAAGQTERFGDILSKVSAEETVESAAQRIVSAVEKTRMKSKEAIGKEFEPLYEEMWNAAPDIATPEMQTLLKNPAIQQAIKEARELPSLAMMADKKKPQGNVQLADEMFDRLKSGESLDDLAASAAPEGSRRLLADTSPIVLSKARGKLQTRIEKATQEGDFELAKELRAAKKGLDTELEAVPGFEQITAAYRQQQERIGALSSPQMEAITALADKNIELAVTKILGLSPTKLADLRNTLTFDAQSLTAESSQANSEALRSVVRGFVQKKLNAAKSGTQDLSKGVFTKGEWGKVETLLGKGDTDALKAAIEREQQIMRGTKSLGGGSDTVPKAGAAAELSELAGTGSAPLGSAQPPVASSLKGVAVRGLVKVWQTFGNAPNAQVLSELADILLLNADKGIAFMKKAVKLKGLEEAGIKELEPLFKQLAKAGITTEAGALGQTPEMIAKGEAVKIAGDSARGIHEKRSKKKKY